MRTVPHRLARSRRLSPRAVKFGLMALGLIVLLDIVTARFSAQVQSSLTLPHAVFNNSSLQLPAMKPVASTVATKTSKTTAAPTSTPVAKATASATTTTTTSMLPANILAQDTFQRPDQQFWGMASDGQSWSGDAAKASAFAIANHTGQVVGN